MSNCAATLNAFEMAQVMLRNYDSNAKAIIVVGERAFTPTVQLIPNTSITGDAAAAVLVSKNGARDRLINMHIQTAGKYHRGIWMSAEESRDFERTYVPLLCQTIQKAISKAGITLGDVKIILPHNVNRISWDKTARALQVSTEKIYLKNISQYGHCFGADILINYLDAKKDALIQPGDYYLMATVGLGASFAAAVFQN